MFVEEKKSVDGESSRGWMTINVLIPVPIKTFSAWVRRREESNKSSESNKVNIFKKERSCLWRWNITSLDKWPVLWAEIFSCIKIRKNKVNWRIDFQFKKIKDYLKRWSIFSKSIKRNKRNERQNYEIFGDCDGTAFAGIKQFLKLNHKHDNCVLSILVPSSWSPDIFLEYERMDGRIDGWWVDVQTDAWMNVWTSEKY